MRLWKKLLIGALVLVLVLVAAGALFISQLDPNEYRSQIADVVESYTGRKLTIGGNLTIKLLPVPSVEASDVSFSNATWASQPDMVRAKRVRAEVALLPLLKGRLVVSRFVAIEPHVFLEIDAKGKANWEFDTEAVTATVPAAQDDGPSEQLNFLIRQARIEKGRIDYLDAVSKSAKSIEIASLIIGDEGQGSRLAVSLRADYGDMPVKLDGRLGAAGAILHNLPIEVDLEGALGSASIVVQGAVGKPLHGTNLRLDVTLDTKSTRALSALSGSEIEEFGPAKLAFRLIESDGHFDIDDIKITARPRDTDASVSGSIKNLIFDSAAAKARGKPAKGKPAKGKPANVNLEGGLGDARFTVAGDIAEPMTGKDLRLKVTLKAQMTKPLSKLAGIDMEEVGPLDVALTVIEKDGHFNLDDIDSTVQPRDADVAIKGSIKDIAGKRQPDLHVSVSAKTLHQLHVSLPDVGPVRVSAKVKPGRHVVEIRDLVASVGKSDLSGSAIIDTTGERPRASAKLQAKLIDLVELAPSAQAPETATVPAQAPPNELVFSAGALPLDGLNKANGDIELTVSRLITRKFTFEKLSVVAKLEDGKLSVKPGVSIAGGTVGGNIDIDVRNQPTAITADVDAKKVSLGTLTKLIRGIETSKGLDSDLQMKLRGQGNSVRDLMAGLSGDVRLVIGEGRLNNDVLDRVGADLLTQIIGVAVPSDEKGETTAFSCGVIRFAINDGEAIADQTLVAETEKVLLKGGGLIDLKTEELDLGANLGARKGIRLGAGSLSSLIRVKGTLAQPELGTDLKGVVKASAKVGVAVVTLGLSLVAESVYGRISEDEHPCQTALARQIGVTPSEDKTQTQ
ncbi:MAG: AsmA family protein [Gammaproteobacteria bacterium]|nr:AsmA family protein [Gammaproteobacteria bacterium]MDX2460846.1 AsmA family protein [Gammaproteobacteria bacterium]